MPSRQSSLLLFVPAECFGDIVKGRSSRVELPQQVATCIKAAGRQICWKLAAIGQREVSEWINAGVRVEHSFGLSLCVKCRDDDRTLSLKVGPEGIVAIAKKGRIGTGLVAGCTA